MKIIVRALKMCSLNYDKRVFMSELVKINNVNGTVLSLNWSTSLCKQTFVAKLWCVCKV